MKYSNTCPKCQNKEIAKINGGGFSGNVYNSTTIGMSTMYLTRYVCVCCGFTENYFDNTDDLEKIRKKYIIPGQNTDFV
jgi:hypothetical protein